MHLELLLEEDFHEQTTIKKTLLLQCFQNNFSHQYRVSIPYDSLLRQLDLGKVLNQILFEIVNPNYEYQIFYYSNVSGYFHFGGIYPFKQALMLGQQFILKQQLFVTFRRSVQISQFNDSQVEKKQSDLERNQNNSKPDNTVKKKKRINDRTIHQTLQKVSQWRTKCQKEKITYEQAAKQIDIPKKTLDDYYSLIKLGEQNGFDFQSNLHQKIGVLRQFVKQKALRKKTLSKGKEHTSIINRIMQEIDSDQEQ